MEKLNQLLTQFDNQKTSRILFVETLHLKDWNGYTARYTRGISGTHTASMYLAEEFVKRGYEVDFVSPNIINAVHLGVNYKNFELGVDKVYDYIFITNNMLDLQIVNKVIHYKKLFIVIHNPLLQPQLLGLFKIEKSKIVIAFISESSKYAICLQQPSLKTFSSILLYNSINLDDIQPVIEKEDSFVFFACSDRGYTIAEKVAEAFPSFKLHSNTYANELKYLLKEETTDSSKTGVFKCLAKSKYFVYPLINLEKSCMHYDCGPYVILEALLHGVIVITIRNPLFEELYGDAVCYIDIDDVISLDCFKTWSPSIHIKVEFSKFLETYTQRFIDKVKLLENNIDLQNTYIRKGLALREKYSNKMIVDNFMSYLTAPKLKVLLFLTSLRQVKEYDYYSFFFNRFTKLRYLCDLHIHCNDKDVSEDIVKYFKQFNIDNKRLFITSKNVGFNMGHIEAVSNSYDAGIFSDYDYVIPTNPDVFMLEEDALLKVLVDNQHTDTVFYFTKGIPDDDKFLQNDFYIFKPKHLHMKIFKEGLYTWTEYPEYYIHYVLNKYNIKYELLKRFDNDNWHPRRIDNLKLWHEHDLTLIEAYKQKLVSE